MCTALHFQGSSPAIPHTTALQPAPLRHAYDMSFEALQEPEPQQATGEGICKVAIPHLLNSHAESARIFYLPDLFFA